MDLRFEVAIKIQKSVEKVFDAVYNPDKLSGYFTNGGASAPLHEGTIVEWAFADNPGEPIAFPVTVMRVISNELIVFEWQGAEDHNTTVVMNFEKSGPEETMVRIAESGWKENQDELNRSYMNCQGWTQMSSALKAFVEYGINLRKGAYEGLYKSEDVHAAAKGE